MCALAQVTVIASEVYTKLTATYGRCTKQQLGTLSSSWVYNVAVGYTQQQLGVQSSSWVRSDSHSVRTWLLVVVVYMTLLLRSLSWGTI